MFLHPAGSMGQQYSYRQAITQQRSQIGSFGSARNFLPMQASLPSKVRFLLLQPNTVPCLVRLDEAGQGQGIQMYPCPGRERNNLLQKLGMNCCADLLQDQRSNA